MMVAPKKKKTTAGAAAATAKSEHEKEHPNNSSSIASCTLKLSSSDHSTDTPSVDDWDIKVKLVGLSRGQQGQTHPLMLRVPLREIGKAHAPRLTTDSKSDLNTNTNNSNNMIVSFSKLVQKILHGAAKSGITIGQHTEATTTNSTSNNTNLDASQKSSSSKNRTNATTNTNRHHDKKSKQQERQRQHNVNNTLMSLSYLDADQDLVALQSSPDLCWALQSLPQQQTKRSGKKQTLLVFAELILSSHNTNTTTTNTTTTNTNPTSNESTKDDNTNTNTSTTTNNVHSTAMIQQQQQQHDQVMQRLETMENLLLTMAKGSNTTSITTSSSVDTAIRSSDTIPPLSVLQQKLAQHQQQASTGGAVSASAAKLQTLVEKMVRDKQTHGHSQLHQELRQLLHDQQDELRELVLELSTNTNTGGASTTQAQGQGTADGPPRALLTSSPMSAAATKPLTRQLEALQATLKEHATAHQEITSAVQYLTSHLEDVPVANAELLERVNELHHKMEQQPPSMVVAAARSTSRAAAASTGTTTDDDDSSSSSSSNSDHPQSAVPTNLKALLVEHLQPLETRLVQRVDACVQQATVAVLDGLEATQQQLTHQVQKTNRAATSHTSVAEALPRNNNGDNDDLVTAVAHMLDRLRDEILQEVTLVVQSSTTTNDTTTSSLETRLKAVQAEVMTVLEEQSSLTDICNIIRNHLQLLPHQVEQVVHEEVVAEQQRGLLVARSDDDDMPTTRFATPQEMGLGASNANAAVAPAAVTLNEEARRQRFGALEASATMLKMEYENLKRQRKVQQQNNNAQDVDDDDQEDDDDDETAASNESVVDRGNNQVEHHEPGVTHPASVVGHIVQEDADEDVSSMGQSSSGSSSADDLEDGEEEF